MIIIDMLTKERPESPEIEELKLPEYFGERRWHGEKMIETGR